MLTRDEAHVLLDAVLDFSAKPRDYDVHACFTPELDRIGMYCTITIFHGENTNREITEMFYVPDELSVWDTMKKIAMLKEEDEDAEHHANGR